VFNDEFITMHNIFN